MRRRTDSSFSSFPSFREDPYGAIWGLLFWEWVLERFIGKIRREAAARLRSEGRSRVLDLGCGTGVFSRILADAGRQPFGLDKSPAMLEAAREKAGRFPTFPLVRGEAASLPFRTGFDGVVMSLALHEMDPLARKRVWKEMRRVLRPGGRVILVDFTVPQGSDRLSRWFGLAIRGIERLMGRIHLPHYQNFLEFMARGGLSAWLSDRGASPQEEKFYFRGNLGLIFVEPALKLDASQKVKPGGKGEERNADPGDQFSMNECRASVEGRAE